MALENQINLYSVDTGNFYTKKERALHNKNAKIRAERKIIAEKIKILHEKLIEYGYSKKNLGIASKETILPLLHRCGNIRRMLIASLNTAKGNSGRKL